VSIAKGYKKYKQMKQKLISIFIALMVVVGIAPTTFGAEFEPYNDTFVISAYYSPLPGQTRYVRGSYEADLRLNGNGTNGADGTQVYPGMLAAPKSYAFGTKLEIAGLGVGAVHDRGGAIVQAGVRGHEHDRLDVWMGAGDEGLTRALNWGVRTVSAKVYPPSHQIAESFALPGLDIVFTADLELGDSNASVKRLQEELKTYGYFRGNISGTFDEDTEKAVLGYQLARSIVASADSAGAGVLGPKTRSSLNSEIFARNNSHATIVALKSSGASSSSSSKTVSSASSVSSRFPVTLSIGDKGDRVRDMQIALTEAGYYECEVNGIYDEQMENCIYKFQESNEIVASRDEHGAGYFGSQTRSKLAALLSERENKFNSLIASEIPNQTSSPDDSGENIEKLQTGLQKLGYYEGELTGEHDEATMEALAAFQVDEGILDSDTSYGAGYFGAKTKTAFNKKLKSKLLAKAELPQNPEWSRATYISYVPKFTASLELGESGSSVKELQEVLKKLGYFEGEATGNFGPETESAVIDFQVSNGVIASADSYGAGVFGPQTRLTLNKAVSEGNVALQKKEGSVT
jgi:peptidoglycan hydrolase-like protein with peptidoglycan-binding domain/3D (Asp-Asp-Asp) domain-containing protein